MEKHCAVKGMHPVLVELVSVTRLSTEQQRDLSTLLHGMTRFMDCPGKVVDFKDDKPELVRELNRLVGGCYVRGLNSYQPNEPMHIEHLIKAMHSVILKAPPSDSPRWLSFNLKELINET